MMRKTACGVAGVALVIPLVFLVSPAGARGVAAARHGRHTGMSPSRAKALSRDVTDHVIIVLKDQPAAGPVNGPAAAVRRHAMAAAQAPILSELHQTAAVKVHTYSLVDAVSATVSAAEASRLAADPAVSEVIPDVEVRGPDVPGPSSASTGTAPAPPSKPLPIPPGACPAPGQPAPVGEELELIHADSNSSSEPTARTLGFTGAGVKVAFMAEGIDTDNPDFIRPDGSHVFVDYKDFSGDGLDAPTSGGEAFLDASAIASQGKTYDVSDFGTVPLAGPCRIKIEGVAPGASLVDIKIFAQNGYSTTSGILQGIDYAVTVDHVDVLNESFGYNPFPMVQAQDIVEEFNDAAVAAGTTVTVAAGDAGPADTIGSPDTDPDIIDVGASNNFRFYADTGTDGYVPPLATKGWISDNISGLSSGGFAESGPTVDLVAPGDTSFAACTPDVAMYSDCTNLAFAPSSVEFSGGTSESSPLTAGVAALVIQAYRKTHAGTSPSPALIKQILVSTADDLGHPADEQGSGLVDAYRAVLAAESIPAGRTGKAHGSQVLLSTGQLHATAAAGTAESWPLTITNLGHAPSTLQLSTRTLGPALDTQLRTVTLSDSGPHFFNNFYNATENYRTTTFSVAPGRDRLAVEIAYKGQHVHSFLGNVDVVLIDPNGNFAADAVPQGVGNAAEVEVRYPTAGTWTALIFSNMSSEKGTVGPVLFQAQTFDFQPLGTVSPARVTIPAGQTATVTVRMTTPSSPGDESAAVVVAGATGPASSVAVTLRSLVSLSSGGHFSGVLTGGNGRQPDLGQSAYYQFDVPATTFRTLLSDVELADGQTDPVIAYLVDPDGQTVSLATNDLVTQLSASGPSETPTSAVQVGTTSPMPGLWTLILNFTPTVTGNRLSEPYSGMVSLVAGPATAAQLPDSSTTVLTAGQPVTVPVTVDNTSDAPQDYFIDARLDDTATVALAPQSSAVLELPMTATASSPSWLVPSDTSEMTLSAHASVPLTFDWGPGIGDPDLNAVSTGDTAVGTWSGSPITSGVWLADPSEIGPYGTSPPPKSKASMAATVETQAFDPSITSPTGDLWLQSVDADATVQVLTVMPGQSAVIPVTITPSAPSGQVVSGTLYVDEWGEVLSVSANAENYQPAQAYFQAGTQIAALPYLYRVG